MNTSAQRIKIVESGWAGYTGILGGVMFEGGISIEPVAPAIAKQLGCILRVESCDTKTQVGHAATMVQTANDRAAVVKPMARASDGVSQAAQAASTVNKTESFYTREKLEAIADERGIAGIRAIADTWNLKGRGIIELIEAILDVQTKNLSSKV